MDLKPIQTEAQHEVALAWVDNQFDKGLKANSLIAEKVQDVLLLIKQYGDSQYSLATPALQKAI